MRKNPEVEPLRQSVVVYNLVLATPATALVPNCNSFAVPLDQSVMWRGGTCYMGNSRSSIYHRPGIHPNLHHTQTQPTDTPPEAGGAYLPGVTMWFPSRTVNNRHGLLPSTVTREIQRTAYALVHRFH